MGMYQGVNASEGIGIGTVMVAVDPDLTFEPHEVADSAAEKERYQSALSVFCEKTQAQADHMKETVGEAEAEIMSGHIVLAQDPGMTDAINAAIDGGTCAEQALMDTSTMFENMFLSMDDEMFRLRAADIADIRTGILAELLGKEVVDLSVLPENTVVVVHDLTPSMTATIDKAHVAGIVTETGGRTSHSAIIARALEIPAVLSVSNSCTALRNGMTVVVDGGKGVVEADPDEETLAAYTAKAEAFAAEKAALEAFRGKPSVTADGIKKIIACNIGNPDDVPNALDHDAEAIGLFRSEFLFMDSAELPSEEEQFNAYRKVASALKGAPVIIRTLDVGGDKEIPYLHLTHDDNPFMGYRAVRYCLSNADQYKVQLRALLRASAFGDIKIMIPLVTDLDEVRDVKKLVEECKAELDAEGVEYNKNIEETRATVEKLQSEEGMSDEEVDAAMEFLITIMKDGILGKFSEESIRMALKAINHDADVDMAGQEGELRGKNAKISEKLRKGRRGDGTASLDGKNGGSGTPRQVPELGALGGFDSRSIFERGGERRTKYK